jgi:septation ring formation regulator EzrA
MGEYDKEQILGELQEVFGWLYDLRTLINHYEFDESIKTIDDIDTSLCNIEENILETLNE